MTMETYLKILDKEQSVRTQSLAIGISSLVGIWFAFRMFTASWQHHLAVFIGGSIFIIAMTIAVIAWRRHVSTALFLHSTNKPQGLSSQFVINAKMKLEVAQQAYEDVFVTHQSVLWMAKNQLNDAHRILDRVERLHVQMEKLTELANEN